MARSLNFQTHQHILLNKQRKYQIQKLDPPQQSTSQLLPDFDMNLDAPNEMDRQSQLNMGLFSDNLLLEKD